MARLAEVVGDSQVVERSARPAAVVLLVVSASAMIVAQLLERGNRPYTLNFLTPTDQLVGVVLFSVPVLGFAVLAAQPRHRSGWLMMAAGTALAAYLLSHAPGGSAVVGHRGAARRGSVRRVAVDLAAGSRLRPAAVCACSLA